MDEWVAKIGKPAYKSIVEMVRALDCDYNRLDELQECQAGLARDVATERPRTKARRLAEAALKAWHKENGAELAQLADDSNGCTDADHARQSIEEEPLSVEVRSGWHDPGAVCETAEFCILLGTGGPAVRIVGDLGPHNEPETAHLEVQDWYKPWTEYTDTDQDVLLAYCRCFYYGE
jgi:hypothetical protein